MTVMEIALLVLGVIIFVVSFLLPEKNEQKSEKDIEAEREEVQRLIEQEIDGMKMKVNEAANDTVDNAVDRAERSLEKVSNEKIMAVNEYAGTVIEEINKNHKEVMFLYDMLRDKQTDLTNIVRKADATVKEIESVSHTAQMASETLLRGMSVASVSQKGLTSEQKAVFDDIVIPDAPTQIIFNNNHMSNPVSANRIDSDNSKNVVNDNNKNASKGRKGAALTQSKIFADLATMDQDEVGKEYQQESVIKKDEYETVADVIDGANDFTALDNVEHVTKKEKVAVDILSGSTFYEGSIVNVDIPAGRSVTAADFAALVNGTTANTDYLVNQYQQSEVSGQSAVSSNSMTQAPANNNNLIIEMSKQGMSTVEIAKTLKLGVGEVKLVLDLFR